MLIILKVLILIIVVLVRIVTKTNKTDLVLKSFTGAYLFSFNIVSLLLLFLFFEKQCKE